MFDFARWQAWLNAKASEMRELGLDAEARSGGMPTPKPMCSFHYKGKFALGQFDVWTSGEVDVDVMHAISNEFIRHDWGMRLDDTSIEEAFAQFRMRIESVKAV
jgi:hypothetical protein